MKVNIETNIVPKQSISLQECAVANWQNRPMKVLAAATGLLTAGAIVAVALGGPLAAIGAIAAAALVALGLFVKSLLSQPRNVPVEQPQEPILLPPEKPMEKPAPVGVEEVMVEETVGQQVKNLFHKTRAHIQANPGKACLGAAAVMGVAAGVYASGLSSSIANVAMQWLIGDSSKSRITALEKMQMGFQTVLGCFSSPSQCPSNLYHHILDNI